MLLPAATAEFNPGSYPGPERYTDAFTYRDYLKAVAGLRTRASDKPLALYLHIPFCDTVYLGYLKREIEMQGRLFAGMNHIEQLQLDGGASAPLSDARMGELMLHLRRCFQFAPDAVGEYAIAVDARSVTRERVLSLRSQGFNRICVGLGQGDPGVQGIVDAAREAGFRSVGIALGGAHGPGQLAGVIAAAPDRVAIGGDAGQAQLGEAGYVYIGMGLFARPGDDLAVAQRQGRLHRHLHGYSTHAEMDLVACGVAAISAVAGTYSQNVGQLESYYDLIDRNELPIERGMRLSMDDALRRTIIQMLMCQFELSISAIEQAYPITFADYFAPELAQLRAMERDGLVALEPDWISVSARGRVQIRSVCLLFARAP
jgi:oxygen-independent coproporphyrinogen-3 oxidase